MSAFRLFTAHQLMIYRDHNAQSRSYDSVSMFGMRPPELVGVFQQTKSYIRFCYIEDKRIISNDLHESLLSLDICKCRWVTLLSQRVYIRINAIDEVEQLVDSNLSYLESSDNLNCSRTQFYVCSNQAIKDLIRIYKAADSDLNEVDLEFKQEYSNDFFYDDGLSMCPVPVPINIHPKNAQHFFIHILLTHGRYITEPDALHHSSPRDMLENAQLIGRERDEESLYMYSTNLFRLYIEKELIFLPNSMRKTDMFIPLVQRLFDDIIMRNEFSATEHPHTMTGLQSSLTDKFNEFWRDNTRKQLQSIYKDCQNIRGIPLRGEVESVTRFSHFDWDPVESIVQNDGQSIESYQEQVFALRVFKSTIDKYINPPIIDSTSLTHTKGVIIHGGPGTGKTHVSKLAVLYALCKGLKIISTSILGARASDLGGTHLHSLFCWTPQKHASTPFRTASSALLKIARKPISRHIILSLDALFIDEIGTLSNQQFGTLDIMFRKARNSPLPFGGLLILGSLDPRQIGVINAMPFLTSTLILTCFQAIKLSHSVRAHHDPDYQELLNLMRTNPIDLIDDEYQKRRFFDLIDLFGFVNSWDDPSITPNTIRLFAKKVPVTASLGNYTEAIISRFHQDGTRHIICCSSDFQRGAFSISEYLPANAESKKTLNKKLREPEKLVFFECGLYECTVNDPDPRGRYNQSSLALMLDLPPSHIVESFLPITMWIAPAGTTDFDFTSFPNGHPSSDQLKDLEWLEVKIGCAPEQIVVLCGGSQAKRMQYALKHRGALTINKSQGYTIHNVAVEISPVSSPWESGQVIVALSRTRRARDTIIVGQDINWVKNKLWTVLCTPTQWSRLEERILGLITLNEDGPVPQLLLTDYHRDYPFRIRDILIPTESVGFVYIIISKSDPNFTYIGQTQNISQRLDSHNRGHGAIDTACIERRPYALAGLISSVGLDASVRMAVEQKWRLLREQSLSHNDSPYAIVRLGESVSQFHNQYLFDSGDMHQCVWQCFIENND